MGLRININVAALTALTNLGAITRRIELSFRRLATGKRIASAADDPAGLAISERLAAQIKGLKAARRNAEDEIGVAQVAEGGLGTISDALTRMRELAVQSANGTLQPAEKNALQLEFAQLLAHIDQTAASTRFNDRELLPDVRATTLGLASLSIGAGGDPNAAIGALDAAIGTVSSKRAHFGATQNSLSRTIESMANQIENLSAAHSRIVDVDIAAETAELTKNRILQEAAISVLAQAIHQPRIALRLLENL
jgi:flagellin